MNRKLFFLFSFLWGTFNSSAFSVAPYADPQEVTWTCDLVYKFYWIYSTIIDHSFPRVSRDKENYSLIEKKRRLKKELKKNFKAYESALHEQEECILPHNVSQTDLKEFLVIFHGIVSTIFHNINLKNAISPITPKDKSLKIIDSLEEALSSLIDFSLDLQKITEDEPTPTLRTQRGDTLSKLFFKMSIWFLKFKMLCPSLDPLKTFFSKKESPSLIIEDDSNAPIIYSEGQEKLAQYNLLLNGLSLASEGFELVDSSVELYKEYIKNQQKKILEEQSLNYEKLQLLRRRKLPKSDSKKGFSAIIGREEEKKAFKNIVAYLKKPLEFERLNVRPPRAALLYGNSGAGKTWFVNSLAQEAGCHLVEMGVKKSENQKRTDLALTLIHKFAEAQTHAPAILFIDEADRFLGTKRQEGVALDPAYSLAQKTFNEIINRHDNQPQWSPPVIIILATNQEKELDDDHLQRCTLKIGLGPLYEDERYLLLCELFEKEIEASYRNEISPFTLHFEIDTIDLLLQKMAKETKQLLPRHISDFVEEARRTAITTSSYVLDEECLRKALTTIKNSMKIKE